MRGALALAALAHACAWPAAAQQSPAQPIRASKIILVGDSTTAVTSGWGSSFCANHVMSAMACLNLARGGRSTSSYRAEGSWDIALGEMRTPGYSDVWVLIQFAHNDQPGKPGRSTDLETEFPANLRRYIAEARAAGARPVLVTPLTRRQFRDGVLQNNLEPWSDAIRAVAAETGVPLVDLNARSVAAVQAMGPALATQFAQFPPSRDIAAAALTGTTAPLPAAAPATPAPASPGQQNASAAPMGRPRLVFDYTHVGRTGADFFAAIVAHELARVAPEMRRLLVP